MENQATARRPPQDLEEKKKLHPLADTLNMIGERNGKPALLCGAKRKKQDARCRQYAGAGTEHKGYGRCRFCAGCSTGPKTPEGKHRVSQNSRKHGLYASGLSDEEAEVYDELAAEKDLDLEHTIYTLKAKIIVYLRQTKNEKQRRRAVVEGTLGAEELYQPGSIEDKRLLRAMAELGRLVEKQARLNPEQGQDLLSQINAELRAASQGKVSISWGGKAQQRLNPVETPENGP